MRFTGRLAIAGRALALGVVAGVLALPAASHAAQPAKKLLLEQHEHGDVGRDWHVEITTGTSPTRLKNVVLYFEECDATGYAEGVAVAPDGSFSTGGSLGGGGTWRVQGTFVEAMKASGVLEMTKGRCTTGERQFTALPASDAPGASHGHGHGSHFASGTPFGHYPEMSQLTGKHGKAAARVWVEAYRAAHSPKFSAYRTVRRRYAVTARSRPRPLAFHLRNTAFDNDGRLFDPARPESLVYWWPQEGPPILVAFMYRSETREAPRLGGGIFGWHVHAAGRAPMTHVWLTRDLRSATANCMPVAELERDIPGFKHATRTKVSGPESLPCETGAHVDGDSHGGGGHH